MKKIEEMTEQEVLALREEDIQLLTHRNLIEKGVKILSCPNKALLEEVEQPNIPCYSVPFMDGYAFTDLYEALEFSRVMKSLKSIRRVEYDWSKLGSKYPYLRPLKDRPLFTLSDFDIIYSHAYSFEKYNEVLSSCLEFEKRKQEYEEEQKAYEEFMKIFNDERQLIDEQVYKVQYKYRKLQKMVDLFANVYYPASDEDEQKAIESMHRSYLMSDEEKAYILSRYKEYQTNKED